jgi:hypothetical protein
MIFFISRYASKQKLQPDMGGFKRQEFQVLVQRSSRYNMQEPVLAQYEFCGEFSDRDR